MSLINCEINLILIWSANCVIVSTTATSQCTTLAITNTNVYVLFVTLSTQDNTKLLQQLKLSFKRTINWNESQSKISMEAQDP